MKLIKARFKNFIGILEGTGRSEITIDFSSAKDLKKIFLFGRNGSGKSTILNSLHPLPDSFDDRELIVEGCKGEKELVYETVDGTQITSLIIWPKSKNSASCQILINGKPTEKTEKGNIKLHAEEVETLLGFTKSHLNIMRIGNKVKNFIDMKPVERKSFIGNFLPELEEWSKAYKNSTSKLSAIDKEISVLSLELNKLSPFDFIEGKEKEINDQLTDIKNIILTKTEANGRLKESINSIYEKRDSLLKTCNEEISSSIFNPLFPIVDKAYIEKKNAENILKKIQEENSASISLDTEEKLDKKYEELRQKEMDSLKTVEKEKSKRRVTNSI